MLKKFLPLFMRLVVKLKGVIPLGTSFPRALPPALPYSDPAIENLFRSYRAVCSVRFGLEWKACPLN